MFITILIKKMLKLQLSLKSSGNTKKNCLSVKSACNLGHATYKIYTIGCNLDQAAV